MLGRVSSLVQSAFSAPTGHGPPGPPVCGSAGGTWGQPPATGAGPAPELTQTLCRVSEGCSESRHWMCEGCQKPQSVCALHPLPPSSLSFIQRWVFGGVCSDPNEDFAIRVDPAALSARGVLALQIGQCCWACLTASPSPPLPPHRQDLLVSGVHPRTRGAVCPGVCYPCPCPAHLHLREGTQPAQAVLPTGGSRGEVM